MAGEAKQSGWIGDSLIGGRDGLADGLNVDGTGTGECCHLSIL